jgi:hypothetical protein
LLNLPILLKALFLCPASTFYYPLYQSCFKNVDLKKLNISP